MDLTNTRATQEAMRLTQEARILKQQVNQISSSKSFKGREMDKELKEAAKGFEEIFVHKMLATMRESGIKSDFLSGGQGEEVFRDMLDQEYAKQITESQALGLSKMIYEQTKESLKNQK